MVEKTFQSQRALCCYPTFGDVVTFCDFHYHHVFGDTNICFSALLRGLNEKIHKTTLNVVASQQMVIIIKIYC